MRPPVRPQKALAERLMRAVGEVHWVDDEELMHAVTAVSGSGPAYVFHMIEAMAAAGVRVGLPEELAMDLARATWSVPASWPSSPRTAPRSCARTSPAQAARRPRRLRC